MLERVLARCAMKTAYWDSNLNYDDPNPRCENSYNEFGPWSETVSATITG